MDQTTDAFRWPDGVRAALSLTFDDARPSQLDVGVPILRAHGSHATFFVSFPLLMPRLEEWRAAAAEGHEIANHSIWHPCSGNFPWSRSVALEDYTLERIETELLEASSRIESLFGRRPVSYGYPCGQKYVGRGESTQSYVPVVARHFLTGRGFRDESPNSPAHCDLAQLLGVDSDGLSFDLCRSWIEQAVREGGWLVFASHEVGEGGRQTMLRSTLEEVCAYCADPANGVWLDTAAAIGAYIQRARGQGTADGGA